MGRFLKYIFGIIITLILLLIAIPFFISMETYKNAISDQAYKHTGRNLKIDGKISLNLLPMPELAIEKVSLSSIKGAKAKNLFEAKRLMARLEFMPLLKGEVIISSIELANPTIKLEKFKNGKSSWEIDLPKESSANSSKISSSKETIEKKKEARLSKEKIPLAINNISITKGNLSYIDPDNKANIENFDIKIALKDLYNLPTSKISSPKGKEGPWSKDIIDLSIFGMANASFDFKASKIKAANHELENFAINAQLNKNILKIKHLSGNILGGKFTGSGSATGNSNQPIDFKLEMKNAKIKDIAPEMNRIKITNGEIDFALNIKSSGKSQYEYVKNLDGSINMIARNGVISGMNLEQITNALNKPRDIVALGKNLSAGIGKGQTPFTSLMNDVRIEKGIVSINKSELVSANTSASAQGLVNLPLFTMDVHATLNSGIKNIPPIKVKLYGPIDNMKHKIDINAIWKHMVKNSLTGVINNLKQGKSVKPKDLLKGIMGGGKAHSEDNNEGSKTSQDPASKLIQKGLKGLFK